MVIEPIIFYMVNSALIIMGLALLVMSLTFTKTINENSHLKKSKDAAENELAKQTNEILEEARVKAQRIIEHATAQSIAIENSAHVSSDTMQHMLDSKLDEIAKRQADLIDKTAQDLLKGNQEALVKVRDENINLFKSIAKDIEDDAIAQVSDFKKVLEQETTLAQKEVGKHIEESYTQVLTEIEELRKEKIAKLDTQIFKILSTISQDVLGKTMSVSDHQQLIIAALEQAKTEDVFKEKT